jgi:hypothetical protein
MASSKDKFFHLLYSDLLKVDPADLDQAAKVWQAASPFIAEGALDPRIAEMPPATAML